MEKNAAGQIRKLKALQRISSFISSIDSLQKLLTLIMEESKQILNAEASSLLLYDRRKKTLYFKVATGEKGAKVKTVELKLGQGIAGVCAKEKKLINVRDVTRDKRFFSSADSKSLFRTRNILAVPLTGKRDKLLGVLEVLNKIGDQPFDSDDEDLMGIIARQAALLVENAHLYADSVKNAKLAGVGEAMLSLSHDIKNILNGLDGGIGLLDETMEAIRDRYVHDAWGIVKSNVNSISDLILDMLNFATRKKPVLEETELGGFICETTSVYREKMKERSVALRHDFDENLSAVRIDRTGMRRVLLNLLSNAFEAVPSGTGQITVSTRKQPQKGRYQIRVEDNGSGIPPDALKKIFDVFFTTKGHKGTGLGLAVVKKITAEHNGLVTVASEPGRGTAFSLLLPADPEGTRPGMGK